MAYDPTKNQGQGTDTIDPSVLGMPFLTIIQKASPEVDESHPQHSTKRIEGAKPGNIVFAPKRKVITQPLLVIPVAQTTLYTEWRPRDQRGGFVGNRPLDVAQTANYRRGQPGTPTETKEYLGSNELIYTIYFMFLFQQGDDWEKGMISFTGTQLKHARSWLKTVANVQYNDPKIKAPLFAATYQLGTKIETNPKGSWYGWDVRKDRVLDFINDEALLTLAEETSVMAVKQLPAPKAMAELPY